MKATNLIYVPDCIPGDLLTMQEMVIRESCSEAISEELSVAMNPDIRFIPVARHDAIGNAVEGYGEELLAYCHVSGDNRLRIKFRDYYAQVVGTCLGNLAKQSLPGRNEARPTCKRISVWVRTDDPESSSIIHRLELRGDGLWSEYCEHWMDACAIQ